MVRIFASSLLACGALAGFSAPAAAYGLAPLFTSAPLPLVNCADAPQPAAAPPPGRAGALAIPAGHQALATSKSAAILGGASALDRIRMDQAAPASLVPAKSIQLVGVRQASAGSDLTPGSRPAPCSRFALPQPAPAFAAAPSAQRQLPGSDDFLQTRRLTVSRTAFDRQWNRVSKETLSRGYVSGKTGLGKVAGSPASEETLAAVNAWANRRIRYVEDARQFGTADYWAGARTTLRLGAGDCEDIAIAKMQLLAALGVARSDMYLTIARDLARRADHAVLVVRAEGRYWMLDNATDRLLDAGESYDYQPVLSFSEGRKWLHGAVIAANY